MSGLESVNSLSARIQELKTKAAEVKKNVALSPTPVLPNSLQEKKALQNEVDPKLTVNFKALATETTPSPASTTPTPTSTTPSPSSTTPTPTSTTPTPSVANSSPTAAATPIPANVQSWIDGKVDPGLKDTVKEIYQEGGDSVDLINGAAKNNIPIVSEDLKSLGAYGYFSPTEKKIAIDNINNTDKAEIKNTIRHELHHAISNAESDGNTPNTIGQEIISELHSDAMDPNGNPNNPDKVIKVANIIQTYTKVQPSPVLGNNTSDQKGFIDNLAQAGLSPEDVTNSLGRAKYLFQGAGDAVASDGRQ